MENKKRKLVLFGIGGLICLFLVIGVSYAIWQIVLQQTNENVITTGCFKINFTEKNDINLNNAYPIVDEAGKKLTPYEFTIENTCDTPASYQVNLEILDTTTLMNHEYIKVMFDEKTPRLLTKYSEVQKTLDNATTSYKLDLGFLEGNTSKTFTLRLWMEEDTPPVEEAMNKIFKSKVTIITSYKAPVDTTNMIAERNILPEGKTVEEFINTEDEELMNWFLENDKYSFLIDSKRVVFQNEINSIEGITPIDISIDKNQSVLAYVDESNVEEKVVYIQANGKIVFPENSSLMFIGSPVTNIDGLENVDTSKAMNMSGMFFACSNLTTLNLSHFDTSNVNDMQYMFANMKNLSQLDLSAFDTSNVTNMNSMFGYPEIDSDSYSPSSLVSLNISNFNTTSVVSMNSLFYGLENLSNLDLSSFDTSNVNDMSSMFYGCFRLTSLDLSSFDTTNVADMSDVFLVF